MPESTSHEVTRLLRAIDAGEEDARARLFELVYDELRGVAQYELAGRPAGATLQATALVNEAYLRLVGKGTENWENRRHFFFTVARAMHDVVVEDARAKATAKRGGDRVRVTLDGVELGMDTTADDLLALDEALQAIERENPRRAEIVRLRFFTGLSEQETAELLDVSPRTVSREWGAARARLALLMAPPEGAPRREGR